MTTSGAQKSAEAFRTISEVAETLKLSQHVLRFWETRFTQIRPLKRAGGRRFYRPEDVELLGAVRQLLYGDGYTIKGVQRILREQGPRAVAALARRHGQPAAFVPLGEAEMSRTDALMAEADDEDAEGEAPAPTADAPAWLASPDQAASAAAPPPGHSAPAAAVSGAGSGGIGDPVARLRDALDQIAACRALLAAARD